MGDFALPDDLPYETLRSLTTEVSTDAAHGVTELTVIAPDHPRLLSVIAGACASAAANIVEAHIFTTTDGFAIDSIFISREFPQDDDEMRRAGRRHQQLLFGRRIGHCGGCSGGEKGGD